MKKKNQSSSFIQDHQKWVGLASVLVIAAVLVCYLRPRTRTAVVWEQDRAYYYDLDTGKLFGASLTRPDLIKGPKGGLCARAMVFSCGDCAQEDQRFIAWLETEEINKAKAPPDQAQLTGAWRHVMASDADDADAAAIRRLIRKPEETDWRARTHEETSQLTLDAQSLCKDKGGTLKPCSPPAK